MSVVGLTLGSAAKATRPSAAIAASVATSAITRVLGWVRSYQAKPTTSTAPRISVEAKIQVTTPSPGCPKPEPGPSPAGSRAQSRGDPVEEAGALLGRERAARAAEHARDLGGEVPAAGEHLGRR